MSPSDITPFLLAAALGCVATASAQLEEATTTELEPLIVKGERSDMDSIGGVYRNRLPCIGDCEETQDQATALQRLLRGIETLFIASSMPEKPEPHQARALVNPIATRLDDKLP